MRQRKLSDWKSLSAMRQGNLAGYAERNRKDAMEIAKPAEFCPWSSGSWKVPATAYEMVKAARNADTAKVYRLSESVEENSTLISRSHRLRLGSLATVTQLLLFSSVVLLGSLVYLIFL